MTIQRRLAKTILESFLEKWEASASPSLDSIFVRLAGNATIVLGFQELTKQFSRLLERSKFSRADLASNSPHRRYSYDLDSIAENAKQYPIFPEDFATKVVQKYFRKRLPSVDFGFGELLKEAETESVVEDIAAIQAILGRYDDAMVTCQSLTDPYRQDHVRYIISIEHYRRNEIQEAQAAHATLSSRILTTSAGIQFALGICNHVPWRVYPYSDC